MAMDFTQLVALRDLMSLGAPDDGTDDAWAPPGQATTGAAAYQSAKLTPGSFGPGAGKPPSVSASIVAAKSGGGSVVASSAAVAAPATNQGGVDPNHRTEVRTKVIDPKAIWDDAEVEASETAQFDDDDRGSRSGADGSAEVDDRAVPEFEILYKQKVTSEDMFLGMNPEQGPSTLSCTHLTVKVHLPGAVRN